MAETLTCTSDDQRMPDKGRMQMVVQSVAPRGAIGINGDVAGTLDANYGKGPGSANYGERDVVVSIRESGQGYWVEDVVAGTLDANMGQSGHANRVATIAQIANYGERGVMQSIGVCVTGDRTHALKAEGADGSEDGTGRGTPIVVTKTYNCVGEHVGFYPTAGQDFPALSGCSPSLKVGSGGTSGNPPGIAYEAPVAFNGYQRTEQDVAWPLGASDGRKVEVGVRSQMAVRRLTPVECERLQGFPDGWTQIPWKKKPVSECPDGPRYKALGNSMACNVMRWIGRRIERVDEVFAELEAGSKETP